MPGLVLGRASVLGDVARRLRDSRLVTITGPGGIGKPTVADATVLAEAHRYPLGSARVDLTLIDDEREVGSAMAAQLGFGSFRALLDSPSHLLAAPGTEMHCLDLADAGVEDRPTGDVIDAPARRAYAQRSRELQAEVAEADVDLFRAERAHAELDTLVDHLTAAVGLGGRTRRERDTTERARSAVTQLIRSTIRRLRASHPLLADHLDASIQTGIHCRYRPPWPTLWSSAGPPG